MTIVLVCVNQVSVIHFAIFCTFTVLTIRDFFIPTNSQLNLLLSLIFFYCDVT